MMVSWYGFFVGVAIVVGILLTEWRLQTTGKAFLFPSRVWHQIVGVSLAGGLVGARLYHVITDWQLYAGVWWQAPMIWLGGLSIIGAVMGGAGAVWLWLRWSRRSVIWLTLVDAVAFALPFSQALGRLGNFFNQELYGLPTNLPWGIEIDISKRMSGFESFATYHPLFAYEALFLLLFGGFIWWHQRSQFRWEMGSGWYFYLYIIYYSIIRYWLDFLRIDRTHIIGTSLGNNQFFLLTAMLFFGIVWFKQMKFFQRKKSLVWVGILGVVTIVVVVAPLALGWLQGGQQREGIPQFSPLPSSPSTSSAAALLLQVRDRQHVQLKIGEHELTVEVVKFPQSITQGLSGRQSIGSDGMLFILPQKRQTQFWMKDMKFGLDLVWIANERVVSVTADVPPPPPNTRDEALVRYGSPEPVDWVLELPAGQAQELGLVTGQLVTISDF